MKKYKLADPYVRVERNTISKKVEVRVNSIKKIEFDSFNVAMRWAYEWCDMNSERNPFLSLDLRGE